MVALVLIAGDRTRGRMSATSAPLEPRGFSIDDTSLAHLKENRNRIEKVLKANLNANEP